MEDRCEHACGHRGAGPPQTSPCPSSPAWLARAARIGRQGTHAGTQAENAHTKLGWTRSLGFRGSGAQPWSCMLSMILVTRREEKDSCCSSSSSAPPVPGGSAGFKHKERKESKQRAEASREEEPSCRRHVWAHADMRTWRRHVWPAHDMPSRLASPRVRTCARLLTTRAHNVHTFLARGRLYEGSSMSSMHARAGSGGQAAAGCCASSSRQIADSLRHASASPSASAALALLSLPASPRVQT